VAVALPLATGPRAATAAALLHSTLHSLQYCCRQQPAWNGQEEAEMAQINQSRDILEIRYRFIEIVQKKISTDLKCLTSVKRGGDCVAAALMERIVMSKALLDRQRQPKNRISVHRNCPMKKLN
jgi:hypothetical protein